MVKRSLATILAFPLAIVLMEQTGIGTMPEISTVQLRDVTQQAGLRFVHNNGAFGKKFLPETMGPGVAFIDYDNDGWPDIFLVNGMDWPGHVQKHTTPKLYHNNHDRSEEHTSELQSRRDLVCRLLLEKKKTTRQLQ